MMVPSPMRKMLAFSLSFELYLLREKPDLSWYVELDNHTQRCRRRTESGHIKPETENRLELRWYPPDRVMKLVSS